MALSPMTRRRLAAFRANRRGFWSLWVFLVLFLASLLAELWANDRPLLVDYDGRLYVPVVMDYPETTFGGDFLTNADYRDPYLAKQIDQHGWALWPPIHFDYRAVNLELPGLQAAYTDFLTNATYP